MSDAVKELCAGGFAFGRCFGVGGRLRSGFALFMVLAIFGMVVLVDHFATAATVATAAAVAIATTVAAVMTTMLVLTAAAFVAAAVAAAIATLVTTTVAAAFTTTIATAFASGLGFANGLSFAAFGLGFAALGFAARVVLMLLEETTKAAATTAATVATKAAAVTPASFSLRFQTDEDNGHGGQSKGHAHQISLHRNTSKNYRTSNRQLCRVS